MDIHEHERYRRQPVSVGLMCDVVADVVRNLRTDVRLEVAEALNALRREMGLPTVKARYRLPAPRGRTW